MLIKTSRLVLEPYGTKHYDTTVVYSTDPENTKMMCFMPCESGEEVMDYLRKCEIQWSKEKPEYLDAAILHDGKHIGAVSVEFFDNMTIGELGWIISKAEWGSGFAYEAAAAFMQYCTEKFGVKKYIAHADSENTASIRVMEKLGMKLVSVSDGRKNRISDEPRREVLYESAVSDNSPDFCNKDVPTC